MGEESYLINYIYKKLSFYESLLKVPESIALEARDILTYILFMNQSSNNNLIEAIESEFMGESRLKKVVNDNLNQTINIDWSKNENLYSSKALNFSEEIKKYMLDYNKSECNNEHDFKKEKEFIEQQIKNNHNQAYLFIANNMPFAYLYALNKKINNISALYMDNNFFKQHQEKQTRDLYNLIVDELFNCLEENSTCLETFLRLFMSRIRLRLRKYPAIKKIITSFLANIYSEKIIVIDSDPLGVIPLILKSIDNRVDFKLFTTIPCLYEVYSKKFSYSYSSVIDCLLLQRKFSIGYRFSKVINNIFYVNKNIDLDINKELLALVNQWINFIED